MSSIISNLKTKLSNFISGNEDFEKEFIYFWDDIGDEVDVDQTSSVQSVTRSNKTEILLLVSLLLAFLNFILRFLNNFLLSIISQVLLIFFILLTIFQLNTSYRIPAKLVDENLKNLQNMELFPSSEISLMKELPPSLENIETLRKALNEMIFRLRENSTQLLNEMYLSADQLHQIRYTIQSTHQVLDASDLGKMNYNASKYHTSNITSSLNEFVNIFDEAQENNFDLNKLVKSISQQINMLALNAGIEAARAGKQGIGFEVVATNLRRLAQHTLQTTNEIKQVHNRINKKAGGVLKDLTTSTEDLNNTIDKSYLAINSISNEVFQASEQIKIIVEGFDKLNKYARLIDDELKRCKLT